MSRTARFILTLSLGAAVLGACSAPAAPSGGGSAAASDSSSTSLVLADAQELGGYNPIRGYGELGNSPLYDGLLRLRSKDDATLPTFEPALATSPPTASADGLTWRVPLRTGVTFHDGSAFDAADVVATYRAILDPKSGSDLASTMDMLSSVAASGDDVVFTLKYPYADFPSRLLIGIAPSEKLTGGTAEESDLNTKPVGTGPYQLTELTADRAVFTAYDKYWGGAAQLKKVTTVHVADDNARAQRIAAGEIDGTSLPPLLARTFDGKSGTKVVTAQSADWRGISLPHDNPFAQDPVARKAMNLAVDRQAMISSVLGGKGRPASTPVASVYGAAYDDTAVFPHDPAAAEKVLDDAGWIKGADGVRAKAGRRAAFTVAYRPTDLVRRDLATAFAADMKKIGVAVSLEGLDFPAIEPRKAELGILLGGGDKPYSLDSQTYEALHTRTAASSTWANPGAFGSAALDTALETGRHSQDEAARTAAYRAVQKDYIADPSHVFLVFLDHAYVMKDSGWKLPPLVVEPHSHGVGWGPWWNLHAWAR